MNTISCKKGVIVRHLMLPGLLFDTKKAYGLLYSTYGNSIYISLMSQYTPLPHVKDFPELNRKLNMKHYEAMVDYCAELGIENAFIQEGEAADESFIPPFSEENHKQSSAKCRFLKNMSFCGIVYLTTPILCDIIYAILLLIGGLRMDNNNLEADNSQSVATGQLETQISVVEIINMMLTFWWLIALMAVLVGGSTYLYSKLTSIPQYQSTGTLLYQYAERAKNR